MNRIVVAAVAVLVLAGCTGAPKLVGKRVPLPDGRSVMCVAGETKNGLAAPQPDCDWKQAK